MSLLHITNGSAIIPLMHEAGISGRIVPWDDVLHEGPVPAGLNAAALRDVRAGFIAAGDGSFDEVRRSFEARDAALEDLGGVDEIVLWFEHDLYDQLQLIQVLDRVSSRERPVVTAVPGDDYLMPGLNPGPADQADSPGAEDPGLSRGKFAGLFAARREISSSQRIAARDAWDAFRASDPRRVVEVIDRVDVLPHLAPALRRHLQQFPSVENGLSRTEQQTLEALSRGVTRVKDVYRAANHEREEAVFMGDLAFMFHIRGLIPRLVEIGTANRLRQGDGGQEAALSGTETRLAFDDELALTDDGRRVLAGEADRVALYGIDRWLGGVHLTGNGPLWRYDTARRATIVR